MKRYISSAVVCVAIAFCSCKKGWIDERSNKSLVVPSVVKDYQALLDNTSVMTDNQPSMGETSSDNYTVPTSIWLTWYSADRNAHVWAPNIYDGVPMDNVNWNYSYRQVMYANIVLDGIDDVANATNTPEWKNAKGSALFYRAQAFYNLVQIYGKAYDAATAGQDLGIPLRLNADPTEQSQRASLQKTYDQILSDLTAAQALLPNVPLYKYRPSKPAAFALLARTYMSMRKYNEMYTFADSCLKITNALLDYNTLNASATYPVPGLNAEVIFESTMSEEMPTNGYFVDSMLYKTYDANDMRKTIFFRGSTTTTRIFIGSYTGGTASSVSRCFNGLAIDEVYLMRAEGNARLGNTSAAMTDLNTLMAKRWKTGQFVPFTASTPAEALDKVLTERRKELLIRGLRWVDIKRLNKDGANITLSRTLNNQTFTLAPNDPKYALPIPPDVIALSGMQQNPR